MRQNIKSYAPSDRLKEYVMDCTGRDVDWQAG